MLRALQLGLSIGDLDLITIGELMDLLTEQSYDENGHIRRATQADFDAF